MRCDVVTVDIDKPYKVGREVIATRLFLYPELAGIVAGWECRPSTSGNTHCVVYLYQGVCDCLERARLAGMLGDDPARTWLNFMRCIATGSAMELFFANKYPRWRTSWPGDWFWG